MSARRYALSDFAWSTIQPLLPNKPRGMRWADDRKVLNGICWRLRTGSPWADIPERYGPATTCANRFRRWAKTRLDGSTIGNAHHRPSTSSIERAELTGL